MQDRVRVKIWCLDYAIVIGAIIEGGEWLQRSLEPRVTCKDILLAVAGCILSVDRNQYVPDLDSCLLCWTVVGYHSYTQPSLVILTDLHFPALSAVGDWPQLLATGLHVTHCPF